VLAHRRVDVEAMNRAIPQARRSQGELGGELQYRASEGRRTFAPGDRALFPRITGRWA
jgi:hypothetical protein